MKKIIILSLLALNAMGETYNLDYFINNQKENKLLKITKKRDLVSENELKRKNYNEIKLLLNTEKIKDTDVNEKENLNFNISYGDFYYNVAKPLKDEDVATQSLGYSKNINSLFYGEESYKLNSYSLEKQITEVSSENTKNDVNLSLIKAYGNLLKIQEKIKLQINYKNNMALEQINMQKRYDNGDLSSIDYEAFKLEVKSLDIELENLKKDFDLGVIELFSISGISLTYNDSLESLEKVDYLNFDNIGKKDLKILELKKAQIDETEKYNFLQNKPQFDFKTDYTLKKNNYTVSLSVSDKFKLTDFQSQKEKLDTEEIDFKIHDQKIKAEEQKEQFKLSYEKQVSTLQIDKEKLDLEKKNLIIKNKKYQIGELSYLDYLKEVEKFKEKEKEILEKEIDLELFLKSLAYY